MGLLLLFPFKCPMPCFRGCSGAKPALLPLTLLCSLPLPSLGPCVSRSPLFHSALTRSLPSSRTLVLLRHHESLSSILQPRSSLH